MAPGTFTRPALDTRRQGTASGPPQSELRRAPGVEIHVNDAFARLGPCPRAIAHYGRVARAPQLYSAALVSRPAPRAARWARRGQRQRDAMLTVCNSKEGSSDERVAASPTSGVPRKRHASITHSGRLPPLLLSIVASRRKALVWRAPSAVRATQRPWRAALEQHSKPSARWETFRFCFCTDSLRRERGRS